MNEAPALSVDELRGELVLVHRTKHRTLHTLLCARGPSDVTVAIALHSGEHMFRTRTVTCELDIRRALAEQRPGENLALLVDHDLGQIPADLVGRIARGKTIAVDPRRRLLRLFGAQHLTPELDAHPILLRALLARPILAQKSELVALDLATAVRTILLRDAGVPADGELNEERLLHHVTTTTAPPAASLHLGPDSPLADELETFFGRKLGPLAPIFWRGWLRGHGRLLGAATFLLHAGRGTSTSSPAVRAVLSVILRPIDERLASAVTAQPALLARWADLAPGLRRRLEGQAAAILEAADDLVPAGELRQELYESPYLPSAFDSTATRLAAALDAALAIGSARIGAVSAELERLAAHDLARDDRSAGSDLVMRARMAARLVTYLTTRPNLEEKARLYGSNGAVMALAQHYVSDGSYVDFARDRARGVVDLPLEAAIARVLERVDALRDADDLAFASAYAGWLTSGSPRTEHVVPIHEGLEAFGASFLEGKAHRKLLVLLLDGMSWPNAVELLQSCDEARYAPLRVGRAGEGNARPMLAALPSLTGVSRSAFFGGKPIKSGQPLATGGDPARFAAHASWRKLRLEPEPDLILKDRLETPSGDVSKETLDAVLSEARVVGVVVNALDDQLKGPRQMRVPADLAHIRPLRKLLDAALDGRRAVLLVADHGHVRTSRMANVGRTGEGKRYRYLGTNDALAEGEVAVSREHAWTPPGKTQVAMLARETDAYGSVASSGEHGGASLSEVVAPALLIGHELLRDRVRLELGPDDPELEVTPLRRPGFWDLEIPRAPAPPSELPISPKPVGRPKKYPSAQIPLLAPEPVRPAPPRRPSSGRIPAVESPALARLRKLPWREDLAKDASRERLVRQIAFLVDNGGAVSADAFAQACGVAVRNVGAAVVNLQESVNFDGYAVVTHEAATRRVVLDRAILESFLGGN